MTEGQKRKGQTMIVQKTALFLVERDAVFEKLRYICIRKTEKTERFPNFIKGIDHRPALWYSPVVFAL